MYNILSLLGTSSVTTTTTAATPITPDNNTNNNNISTTISKLNGRRRHCLRQQHQKQLSNIQQWKRPCCRCRDSAPSSSTGCQQQPRQKRKKKKRCNGPSMLLKLNSAALWSLLAEKFAGDLCQELWTDEVGDLLLHFLADPDEDLRVRIFALIALEKFALTGK